MDGGMQPTAARLSAPADTGFVTAAGYARAVADSCTVAFWMERHRHDVAYHRGQADKALHSLADLFGYRLEAK